MTIEIIHVVRLTLMLIAFGIGLGLQPRDFAQVVRNPKCIVVGLAGQIIVLPSVATLIALVVPTPALAAGLLLIGVCPGGSSSNYFTFLARGDVALSIALTAISGLLAVVTVPIVFNFASAFAMDRAMTVELPLLKTMRDIVLLLVVPVVFGMAVRYVSRGAAATWSGKVSTAAFMLLVVLTPVLIGEHFSLLVPVLVDALLVAAALLGTMMIIGVFGARMLKCPPRQTRSITIEIGVQNVALAVFLALAYLGDVSYVAVPIAYLIAMYIGLVSYVFIVRRSRSWSRPAREN